MEESFVVSARKYRPQGFEEVVGQEHITTTLQNAIDKSHLAQALLFCGPRGVGKTTCARIVAKLINGFNEDDDASTSLNIYELDAASNNSVDDIRSLVEQVRYPPQYGKYKVYIIDEVHMLSNAAFNAFLKTLEEPPSYAIFILATTEKHKIIPTILSRCQIFDFNRIGVSNISDHLASIADKEGIKAEPEALHLISQKADGALRDALSLFDLINTFSSDNTITYKSTIENLHILDYDYYFKVTDQLLAEDITGVLLTFDDILKEGFDGHIFIAGLAEHFRNVMVCKDQATIKLLEVSESIQKKYADQSSNADLSFLLSALNISNQCDLSYKNSKNQRLHVELALMKMCHVNSAINLASSNPEALKKKASSVTAPPVVEKKTENSSVVEPQADLPKTPSAPTPEDVIKADKTNVEEPVVEEKKSETTAPPKMATQANTPMAKEVKSTFKIPKMGDVMTSLDEEKNAKPEVVQQESNEGKPTDTFSMADLRKYWDEYTKKMEVEGRINHQIILKDRELAMDGDTIKIKLDNTVQEEQIVSLKEELMTFLRQKLNNYKLMIESEVVELVGTKMLYTAQEKYNHLSEIHPMMDKLKDAFGLETEY